jgi:GGDEF domain-containing protein
MIEQQETSLEDFHLLPSKEWHEKAALRVDEAHAKGTPLCIIFTDLDNLKGVNDEKGHPIGTEVISEVVVRLAKVCRINSERSDGPADLIAHTAPFKLDLGNVHPQTDLSRIGGDEFATCADTALEGGQQLAKRQQEAIEAFVNLPENKWLKQLGFGASVGVAELKPGMSVSDLLKEADDNMYKNKLERRKSFNYFQRVMMWGADVLLNSSHITQREYYLDRRSHRR